MSQQTTSAKPETLTQAQLQAKLAEQEALIQRLMAQSKAKIGMKVSEKGAVSLTGMGRFPVTLYADQWLTVLDMEAQIRQFIADHKSSLKSK